MEQEDYDKEKDLDLELRSDELATSSNYIVNETDTISNEFNETNNDTEDNISTSSNIQKLYDEILIEEADELEDGEDYESVLTAVKAGRTKKNNTPVIYFIHKVEIDDYRTIKVPDSHYLSTKSEYGLKLSLKKLKKMLAKFNFELDRADCEDANSIAFACQWLVGTRATIKQTTKNGFKTYEVISTENV